MLPSEPFTPEESTRCSADPDDQSARGASGMRVGINARLLCDPSLRGWNRYTLNLLAELPNIGVDLILYADRALHAVHRGRLPSDAYPVRVAPAMRYASWEQRWLPARLKSDAVDVFHTPFHFGMPFFTHCPRVVTLHDAIDQGQQSRQPLRNRIAPRVLVTNLYRWIARTRAHQIITVSEHAKNELISHYGFAPNLLTVTPEAADAKFHREISQSERERLRAKFQLGWRYIWYVGGYEERKNVQFLIRAFAAARLRDVRLLLAGANPAEQEDIGRVIGALHVGDRVRLVGVVDDEDLAGLYAEAICFVYPSLQEGFGLQLCEAMATGCPTFAARASSLPEVLGNGGETFTLNDTAELSGLLQRVVHEPAFRNELVERANARSKAFSWRHTAERTAEVYGKAVEEK